MILYYPSPLLSGNTVSVLTGDLYCNIPQHDLTLHRLDFRFFRIDPYTKVSFPRENH